MRRRPESGRREAGITVKVAALRGLRAGDLPPLEGELGAGLVALAGSTENAAEVRRALLWAVATGDDAEVEVEGGRRGATLEQLWGAAGDPRDAVAAAVGWVAGPALARVEAARAVLLRGGGRRSPSAEPGTGPRLPGGSRSGPVPCRRSCARARAARPARRVNRGDRRRRAGDHGVAARAAGCRDPPEGVPRSRERAEGTARAARGRRAGGALPDLRPPARRSSGRSPRAAPRGVGVGGAGRPLVEAAPRPAGGQARAPACARGRGRAAGGGAYAAPAARAAVLREAGRVAERITGGRVLWVRPAEDAAEAPPVGEGIFHGGAPAARDRAAVEVACWVAAARLARAAGAPLHGMGWPPRRWTRSTRRIGCARWTYSPSWQTPSARWWWSRERTWWSGVQRRSRRPSGCVGTPAAGRRSGRSRWAPGHSC